MGSPVLLTPGMRVLCRDAEWLVTRVHSIDHATGLQVAYCTGADELVRGHEAAFLTELDDINPIDPGSTRLVRDNSHGFQRAKLFLEAQLRQMPLTDPTPHVEGIGAFQPMNFQIHAVQKALGQMRTRLLLADAVGLGKTIEVGMILAELIRRGRADRILVLTKKSMLTQFQAELWNRFAIPLVRMDSVGLSRLRLRIPASKNPFEVYHRVIISMDTLKDVGRYRHFLENTRWDVVIIDEAHNVAGATSPEKNYSYRLARLLSRRTDSMILTTATPHNGKRETFGRLISLLDPSAIHDPKLREYTADDIKPFFLMRFKEDVRGEAGGEFAERQVVPLAATTVEAAGDEELIYTELAGLRSAQQKSGVAENGKDAIIRWGLYKRFLSSPEACLSTVERRLATLDRKASQGAEVSRLNRLREALSGMSINCSSRYRLLVRELHAMGWNGRPDSPRVLLFTESRVSQTALAQALAKEFRLKYSARHEDQANQVIAAIHGTMPDVSLTKSVESFGTGSSPIRLLIATDVASEGVNLHHQCWNIIHYDLPWSIITLIQRNGRIDRFGQRHAPIIRYLMVHTSNEKLRGDEEIFSRLVTKVEEINRSTRSGQSILRLYDQEKEEEFLAEKGILAGNADVLDEADRTPSEASELDAELLAASRAALAELEGLFDDNPAPNGSTPAPQAKDSSRVRLYEEGSFLTQGFAHLCGEAVDKSYHPIEKTEKLYILTPPSDLKRRLGDPSASRGVIFGATAIPEEAWPDDGRLRLTTDINHANTAIRAAMEMRGHWSQELLLTELHPAMRWLTERLMMLIPRGEAPLIASPYLEAGELCFCFIGQVSSLAGTPLIVDAHAISFLKGGQYKERPLKEALNAAGFSRLADTGRRGARSDAVLTGMVAAAVNQSIEIMRSRREQRKKENASALEKEEARLQSWKRRRIAKVTERLNDLPQNGIEASRLRKSLEEDEKYLQDRTINWKNAHFEAADRPTTRLILAIEGVA